MVGNIRYTYLYDAKFNYGIGYIIIKNTICNFFSKDMVG